MNVRTREASWPDATSQHSGQNVSGKIKCSASRWGAYGGMETCVPRAWTLNVDVGTASTCACTETERRRDGHEHRVEHDTVRAS